MRQHPRGLSARDIASRLGGIPVYERQLAECERERQELAQEREDIDKYAELQEFFRDIRAGSEFVDVQAILQAMVHHVTVDMENMRGSVTLKLPAGRAGSNSGEAGNGAVSPDAERGVAVSPDVASAGGCGVRSKTAGEGETAGSLSLSYRTSIKRGRLRIRAA